MGFAFVYCTEFNKVTVFGFAYIYSRGFKTFRQLRGHYFFCYSIGRQGIFDPAILYILLRLRCLRPNFLGDLSLIRILKCKHLGCPLADHLEEPCKSANRAGGQHKCTRQGRGNEQRLAENGFVRSLSV